MRKAISKIALPASLAVGALLVVSPTASFALTGDEQDAMVNKNRIEVATQTTETTPNPDDTVVEDTNVNDSSVDNQTDNSDNSNDSNEPNESNENAKLDEPVIADEDEKVTIDEDEQSTDEKTEDDQSKESDEVELDEEPVDNPDDSTETKPEPPAKPDAIVSDHIVNECSTKEGEEDLVYVTVTIQTQDWSLSEDGTTWTLNKPEIGEPSTYTREANWGECTNVMAPPTRSEGDDIVYPWEMDRPRTTDIVYPWEMEMNREQPASDIVYPNFEVKSDEVAEAPKQATDLDSSVSTNQPAATTEAQDTLAVTGGGNAVPLALLAMTSGLVGAGLLMHDLRRRQQA